LYGAPILRKAAYELHVGKEQEMLRRQALQSKKEGLPKASTLLEVAIHG
jgi:hypothetical protein